MENVIKKRQDKEGEYSRRWGQHIQVNGISLRTCKNVVIDNCIIKNCRSGGIVLAFCKNVIIRRCRISHSFYDGIVLFQCRGVTIENCIFDRNGFSAIRIDSHHDKK